MRTGIKETGDDPLSPIFGVKICHSKEKKETKDGSLSPPVLLF